MKTIIFDLKDAALFMYKAAIHRYIFYLRRKLNENCELKPKILFSKDFVYKCNASIHVTNIGVVLNCSL